MNRASELLFHGLEAILNGLFLPLILSAFASLVQVALFGWQGIRQYAANFCTSIFMGLITHWALTGYDLPGETKAIIVSASALISYNVLKFLVSKQFLNLVFALIIERLRGMAGKVANVQLPENSAGDDHEKGK